MSVEAIRDMYIYSIHYTDGKRGTCPSRERIYDPLDYFRRKFGADNVERVYERNEDGKDVPSTLLPMSQEEADAIKSTHKKRKRWQPFKPTKESPKKEKEGDTHSP